MIDSQITLPEFLLARINEDENTARDASIGGRWRFAEGDSIGAWSLYDEHWTIASLTTYDTKAYDYDRLPAYRHPGYVDADANGRHIARHDPARVLADCEAKRRRLALHLPTKPNDPPLANYGKWCRQCTYCDADGRAKLHEMPCPTLKLEALPYADHEDWREEWRP